MVSGERPASGPRSDLRRGQACFCRGFRTASVFLQRSTVENAFRRSWPALRGVERGPLAEGFYVASALFISSLVGPVVLVVFVF